VIHERSVLWRRRDAGHESARLGRDESGRWRLEGTAVFVHESDPCRLDYRVLCTADWTTIAARVDGWVGARPVMIHVDRSAEGRWRLNGISRSGVDGSADVDLNFSPSTNLLPIRRLGLAVGQQAAVRAAWLRFPSFELEPLEQVYRRMAERQYRYESGGGRFVADIDVDEHGFATRYLDVWHAVAAS
jgi:hypothetical protein